MSSSKKTIPLLIEAVWLSDTSFKEVICLMKSPEARQPIKLQFYLETRVGVGKTVVAHTWAELAKQVSTG